eukprot:SAG31_NODE_9479_length_1270_cov_2.484202_1_plen_336_part_00
MSMCAAVHLVASSSVRAQGEALLGNVTLSQSIQGRPGFRSTFNCEAVPVGGGHTVRRCAIPSAILPVGTFDVTLNAEGGIGSRSCGSCSKAITSSPMCTGSVFAGRLLSVHFRDCIASGSGQVSVSVAHGVGIVSRCVLNASGQPQPNATLSAAHCVIDHPQGLTEASGYNSIAITGPNGLDCGTCTPLRCPADHHVVDHACTMCPAGSTKPAGDYAEGADTVCIPTRCPANFYVRNHACTGINISYDLILSHTISYYLILSHAATACPAGKTRPITSISRSSIDALRNEANLATDAVRLEAFTLFSKLCTAISHTILQTIPIKSFAHVCACHQP